MLDIAFNRDAAARLGVTARDVQEVIAATVGGRQAGVIFEGDRKFPVVIRLSDAERANFATLGQTPVPTPSGAFVPLASVADIRVADGPNQISRENGKRRVVVQANVRGRDVAGVVADGQAAIERDVRLPAGIWLEWGGQFENLASARDRLMLVVPVCFAVILLLLYGALGRVRDAAIVFSSVPLALAGGVAALMLRGMPFSISAAVGFIALSGIAVLNGLVMVTSIQDLMRAGMDPRPRQPRGRPAPAAAGGDDRAGRLARLRADGVRPWRGRGGAEAARDRGDRRFGLGDFADPVRAAGPLRPVRPRQAARVGSRIKPGWRSFPPSPFMV